MNKEPLDEFQLEEDQVKNKGSLNQSILSNDLLLLLVILFIFFSNTDKFAKQFKFLNDNVKKVKDYLDMADATLQALDQASQIPKQMLD
ncbi:hypothetical protein [Halonatronum saccharophilum]|uniref:hypothetical protein n=1 Tax=Halonatronum saccharophilum TaxID=150060 RepID=UPI000488F6B7|nr:hypothetical protein [Halonatronum saccharophilum]